MIFIINIVLTILEKGIVIMKFDLYELVECFTTLSFNVQGVYRYKIPVGKQGKQKTAPFPGFVFPLGGKARFGFNGTSYITDARKIIHGGADMELDKKVIGKSNLHYISILYDVKQKSSSRLYLYDSHFELKVGQSLRLRSMLNRLWKISNLPGVLSTFQRETLFRCIMEEIFLCADNQTASSDLSIFSKISYYIQENYAEEISISELAELYEMNTNRLYYLFTKYAGMGPGDYLIAYRLNRAKELLLTTDVLIHEVANEVGYIDSLYFSRVFKKRFGVAPSEMRKKFRNNP